MSPSQRPRRHRRAILVVVTLVASLLPVAVPVAAAEDKPTLLGMVTDDFRQDIPDFKAGTYGRPPAIYQLFWTTETDLTGAWPPALLSDLHKLGMTPYIEITTNDLAALNNGAKDSQLKKLATTVGDWLKSGSGRHIMIAALPEMNLAAHPWGGDPSAFKQGYTRIRRALLDEGLTKSQIRFVFSPNGVGGKDGEYDEYYPGDASVDIVGFSKTNRGEPWRDYETTFQMHIDELRSRISLSKPILITHTASVSGGGKRDQWLDAMFTKLKAHEQVIGAVYISKNSAANHDFDVLINGQLVPAFAEGYLTWSEAAQTSWIFDGRMDEWVTDREERFRSGFVDADGHLFETAIRWLADQEITSGCNPPLNTLFCPDDPVTRGQMAVFMSRALELAKAAGDHFDDDAGLFYEEGANRLFEAGISSGCDTSRYCGDDYITRAQMAALLARALDLPATNQNLFVDDHHSIFETGINKIGNAKITTGCNPPSNDRFCPTDLVTRGQMATFLKRALTG